MIDDSHIKLECLRLAANGYQSTGSKQIVDRAREYSEFVLGRLETNEKPQTGAHAKWVIDPSKGLIRDRETGEDIPYDPEDNVGTVYIDDPIDNPPKPGSVVRVDRHLNPVDPNGRISIEEAVEDKQNLVRKLRDSNAKTS